MKIGALQLRHTDFHFKQSEHKIFFLFLQHIYINMLTLSQLEQHLSKAAWILKGPVDAADFKVYIFPLLFFKRISDVYDEKYDEILGKRFRNMFHL